MRPIRVVAAVIGFGVVATGAASQSFTPHARDMKAVRIVERDWCDLARYDQARRLGHLSHDMRRNLIEAEALVRRHRNGCALAEEVSGRHHETIRQRGAWLRMGRNGPCARGALPLKRGDTARALRWAASGIARRFRAIVVAVNDHNRAGNVGHGCGAEVRRRTVVVSFSLSALLPAASASEHVVAVSHFRRHGWRTWLLLH